MVSELREKVVLINELGLHARAASAFVKVASKYKSNITVKRDEMETDGRSLMGLITLTATKGMTIELIVSGEDAAECISELKFLINEKFGEDR